MAGGRRGRRTRGRRRRTKCCASSSLSTGQIGYQFPKACLAAIARCVRGAARQEEEEEQRGCGQGGGEARRRVPQRFRASAVRS